MSTNYVFTIKKKMIDECATQNCLYKEHDKNCRKVRNLIIT